MNKASKDYVEKMSLSKLSPLQMNFERNNEITQSPSNFNNQTVDDGINNKVFKFSKAEIYKMQKKNDVAFKIQKKIIVLTIFLLAVGIGLYASGFVVYILSQNRSNGIVFWVIGTLVLIPGIYYFGQIIYISWIKDRKTKVKNIEEMNQQIN